jgi:hypothetical protein
MPSKMRLKLAANIKPAATASPYPNQCLGTYREKTSGMAPNPVATAVANESRKTAVSDVSSCIANSVNGLSYRLLTAMLGQTGIRANINCDSESSLIF